MAFKSKSPSKGMSRSQPLRAKASLQAKRPYTAKPASALDLVKAQKIALQRSTIRALEKAKREAAAAGVDLSKWETEFIDGVTERVKTYGRAFADPDKGAINGTLSLRQGVKLREIRNKAKTKRQGDT